MALSRRPCGCGPRWRHSISRGRNPFGDEGLATLLPPPPPAGAPPPTGVLTKLKALYLNRTQVTDAGCAALVAALDSGNLPALEELNLKAVPASEAGIAALHAALVFCADGPFM